mgnify:CR=1 FL=1
MNKQKLKVVNFKVRLSKAMSLWTSKNPSAT